MIALLPNFLLLCLQLENEIGGTTKQIVNLEDELDKVMEQHRLSIEKLDAAEKVATNVSCK